MAFQAGNSAFITGGASGIGLALAAKCVATGMRVLLADRNEAALAAAQKSMEGAVSTICMDVGRAEDWQRVPAAVDAHLGSAVHLLALNAGMSLPSTVASEPNVFQKVMDVNFMGVVHGLSLLPVVEKTASSASASIVITGSKQGITNPPGNPAYNASKAAVRSLAEQLSFDLARRAPRVSVHLLVPGWTFTGMSGAGFAADGAAKAKPLGAWWPTQVVDYLVPAMAAGRFYVLCPDNEVDKDQDRRRVLWSAGDIAFGRPPLSRWRPEFKEEVKEWMDKKE